MRVGLRSVLTLDYRSMALFRVAVGGVVIADLVARSGDILAFYSDAGVFPRSAVVASPWASVYAATGGSGAIVALFAVTAAAALAFALGYRTKLANAVTFALLLSLHHRNEMILQGGDHLLRLLLFWSLFLPLGAKYSLDARVRPGPPGDAHVSVANLGVLAQLALVYWFTGLQKLFDPLWLDGSAIGYALLLDDFAKPFGVMLLGAEPWLHVLTWLTLLFELVLPLLIFSPKRTAMLRLVLVPAFCAMHVAIHFAFYVGMFTPVTLAAWTVVLPSTFWNGLRRNMPVPAPVSETASVALTRTGFAVLALLALVALANLTHTPKHNFALPHAVARAVHVSGLGQNWSMFTHLGGYQRGWFIVPARLADGSEVDLFRAGQPLSWDRPARPFEWLSDNRWYKYFVRIGTPPYARARASLGPFLCARWNGTHAGPRHVDALVVAFVAQAGLPSEAVAPASSRVLVAHACSPRDAATESEWLSATERHVLGPSLGAGPTRSDG